MNRRGGLRPTHKLLAFFVFRTGEHKAFAVRNMVAKPEILPNVIEKHLLVSVTAGFLNFHFV